MDSSIDILIFIQIDFKKEQLSNIAGGPGTILFDEFTEDLRVLTARRDALGRTFTGSMDTFKSTLDASTFEWKSSDKILEAQHQAANLALKNQILASQALEDLTSHMRNAPIPAIISDSSTKVVNEGDIVHNNMSAIPGYSVANMLAQSWISHIGNPHGTLQR